MDINITTQLHQTRTLLDIDKQRANAQSAIMRIQNRLLKILLIQREIYIEGAKLMGIEEKPAFARQMRWFDAEELKQHGARKKLAEDMLKLAIGQE